MTTQALAMFNGLSVPGENLATYISQVNKIPLLSSDEEKTLAEQYSNQGDVDAARQLVMAHLRFVVHIARTYAGYGLPQGDLIQEGNIGLMKAVKRFDPSMGVRLVSFAVHWIKAEIHEYVIRNWRMVKIATTKAQRKLFFNLRSLRSHAGALTLDEAQAIADTLKVTREDVIEMQSRLGSADMSLDPMVDDDAEGPSNAPIGYLAAADSYDPLQQLEEADTLERSNSGLQHALASLNDRQRYILQRRWLDDNKATLHELADELDISAERVRQVEKSAMEKIKGALSPLLLGH